MDANQLSASGAKSKPDVTMSSQISRNSSARRMPTRGSNKSFGKLSVKSDRSLSDNSDGQKKDPHRLMMKKA